MSQYYCFYRIFINEAPGVVQFSCVFYYTIARGWIEKGITAAWRSPKQGGSSKTGWELQNRAWLPPIDKHAHFFSPKQIQRKLHPTDDSKDFIGCVNHSVNFLHYATKGLTPKPTPHLTLTLTSEIDCTAG